MRLKRNYLIKFLLLTIVISMFSCVEEDYPMVLDSNQKASLGALQSFEISPGNNRVQIVGVIKDPNISEVKFFWNDRSNSMVVPVTSEVDTIREIIDDLEEKMYIFEAQTFDEAGNSSKIVSAGAEVFGSGFADSAGNREVVSSALKNSLLEITYSLANRSSGIIGTELLYEKTNGEQHTLFLDPDQNSLSITDYKSGSTFSYRSLYLPSLMAMDTVFTNFYEYTPIALPQLKNASAPFEVAEASGRWGTLAEWTTNEAIKNHDGYGGWDANNGFNVESGWGAPAIENGKIYQTVTATAASFTLHVNFNDHNHSETDEGGFFMVIAKGDGLPNVSDIVNSPDVLGYARVTSGVMEYSIPFTVPETMEISVGISTTQDDSGRFGPINSFEIGPGN